MFMSFDVAHKYSERHKCKLIFQYLNHLIITTKFLVEIEISNVLRLQYQQKST